MRAYAHAKATYDAVDGDEKRLPSSRVIDLVREIEFGLVQASRARPSNG